MTSKAEVTVETNSASGQSVVHTPGPWQVEFRHDDVAFGVSAPAAMMHDCDVLCQIPNTSVGGVECNNANASLIADAPKMLELLRTLSELAEPTRVEQHQKAARAAFGEASRLVRKHCAKVG